MESGIIMTTTKTSRSLIRAAASLATVIVTATLGLAVASPATASTTSDGANYVALGDSFASGPLISPVADAGCSRSTLNYAHLLSTKLKTSSFTDVTCDSAGTYNFTHAQQRNPGGITYADAPPQFNALNSKTSLVTITIGGNDTNLVGIADSCINYVPTALGGKSCIPTYVVNGVDTEQAVIKQFGVSLSTALDQIKATSPKARVVLTSYALYLRTNGCWPTQPFYYQDANYLQGEVDSMNATIKSVALAHGDDYVDLRTPGAGHDSCAAEADRWVEGVVPNSWAAPLHPNQNGEAAFANIIATYLAAHP